MILADFLHGCGFSAEFEEFFAPFWLETSDEMPQHLTVEFFRRWMPLLELKREIPEVRMEALSAAVRSNAALRIYANLLDGWLLRAVPGPDHGKLPYPVGPLGEEGAGLFSLMAAMAALPRIAETHAGLGLDESYLRGIAKWIAGTTSIYGSAHNGLPGTDFRQHHWLKHSIDGRLFRIGRFEFLIHSAPDWVPAIYRNRVSGRIEAFCRDGWNLDDRGFRCGGGGTVATLDRTGSMLTGIPVDPATGRAVPGVRRMIDLAIFEPLLTPHEWVPSVHIPGGGGMMPELAGESLRAAVRFFRKQFRKEIRLFVCESWILNPAWMELLPESNLAKFMRELFLFPAPPEERSGLFFVFGRDDGDFAAYPADNSLRRAFHRLYESEGVFRAGGMFIPADGLDRWGKQIYRSGHGE